jgi:signal transduction histidine kinase/CheY-like chemotaxis protein
LPYERPGIARSGALLIIAAVVPVLVFAGFSAVGVYSQRQAELRRQAISEARGLVEAVDRELAASLDQAEALAALPVLDPPQDEDAFAEIARRELARHPLWLTVLLIDANGRRLVNTRSPGRLGPTIAPDSFRQALLTRRSVIGGVVRGPESFGIPLRAPVIRGGQAIGAVTVVVKPDGVTRLLAQEDLPADWIATVVDGDGHVVTRTLRPQDYVGKPASGGALQARDRGDSGIYDGTTLEGVRTVSAFWQSPVTGWSVHIGIPRRAFEAPLNRSIAFTAAGSALSLLLSAVFAALLIRELRLRRRESLALEQTHRLEALGRLTGGVAHDFNNLLMIIQGNAETLQRRLTAENARRPLAAIRDATERASRLTRELLVFARGGSAEHTVIDLNDAVREFLEALTQAVGPGVAVETDLDPQAGAVEIDRVQFELALLNLAVNARDAMDGAGQLTIATRRIAPDRVAIRVSDSGPGIPPAIAGRAFDPFFTTKPPGSGTGLGLTQVYSLAKQAGGVARIEAPERGASILIELPASVRAPDAAAPEAGPPDLHLTGRRILLLDDNEDVRSVTAEHLRDAGAAVVEGVSASDGLAALESDRFDLIISDIVMPGGADGLVLAEQARARRPGLPLLLVSGYSESTTEALARGFPVLRKPFSLSELDSILARLLGPGARPSTEA